MQDEAYSARFWAKVDAKGICWEWTAARSKTGYGKFRLSGPQRRTKDAHRVAWEALVGPVPEGLELDHLCKMRHCVNPDHMEPVTHAENMRRGHHAPGGVAQSARTHCPAGHPYDDTNTHRSAQGRKCRACARARARAAYHRAKEAA